MMKPVRILIALSMLGLAACEGGEPQSAAPSEADRMAQRAKAIAERHIVVDTHIDVPYRMVGTFEDVAESAPMGQFDYPRAKAGGLDAAFMSIYTPAGYEFERPAKATAHANLMIDLVEAIARAAPDKFAIAVTPDEVEAAAEAGRIALPLGMENGAPIAGEMRLLRHFFDRGIRYITLAHSRSNHLADSSYDEQRPNGGLSDFGKEVVGEMNALGIMVDASHLSDRAVEDVLAASSAPIIASHSSARHFTPGFERNLSDALIAAIGETGGVVMINYGSAFLTKEANAYNDGLEAAYKAWLAETGKQADDDLAESFGAVYRARTPYPFATLSDVLDHIDHVVEIAGLDHVGLGSDYDGVGNSLPTGLKDVSTYPTLVAGLLERGYSEEDIAKILGGNLLRAWRDVEAVAAQTAGQTEQAAGQ